MPNYSVAIIGYGAVTPAHIKALTQVPNVKVVAIVSNHLTQNEYNQTKAFGELQIFKSLEDLLQSDLKIDVIDICSRPDLHKEQAIRAAQAGKHLIIEKPLALNLDDCNAIQHAVKTAGVQACVCYECRFSDQFQKAQHAIETYIGDVRYCNISYFHGIGPKNPQFYWNTRKASGGNSLLSAGCHALDGALYFMDGEVSSVYSVSTKQTNPDFSEYEYDPIQSVMITFEDGCIATVTSNIANIGPYYFPMHICGNKGTLIGNQVHTTSGEHVSLDMKLLGSGDPNDHPYLEQFKAYFQALSENKPMPKTDLETALKTHQVIEAAAISVKEQRVVPMHELFLTKELSKGYYKC